MPSPEIALDLSVGQLESRPTKPFDGPKVWSRADLSPDDWLVALDEAALGELRDVVTQLRQQNLPLHLLSPDLFDIPATRKAMAEVRRRAYDGHGFAIADRLPLDEWSADEARAVQWVVLNCVSQPVAQSAYGEVFREIKDTPDQSSDPRKYDKGLSQQRLTFHSDNSGNRNIPNFSTLLCINGAAEGGLSEYCSVYSLYNAMLEDAPEQLDRLMQPFFHNRQGIQIPGEADTVWAPALGYDGERLTSRISLNKIPSGYQVAGEELDNLGRDALESVLQVIRDRDLSAKYMLERGQILVFNNREGLHHREAFKNGDTVETQRHLVRMWLRDEGRPFHDG